MTPKERLAKLDEIKRTWAAEHEEDYQGYEDYGDFVIWKTKKPLFGGVLELRCDNVHLHQRDEQYISNVGMLAVFDLEAARAPDDLITYEKKRLLAECRAYIV